MDPHAPGRSRTSAPRGPIRLASFIAKALLAVVLAAALLPAIPVVASAGDPPIIDPGPLPPPLPDIDRTQIPSGPGPTVPRIISLPLGGAPEDMLSGLTKDPSASTAFSDSYLLNGAEHVARIFVGAGNYQDSSGNWVPISPALAADKGGGFTNKANSFTVHFPPALTPSSPIRVDFVPTDAPVNPAGPPPPGYSFYPEGITGVLQADKTTQSSLTYSDALAGVGITYGLTVGGYTETITLATAASLSSMTFDIATTGGVSLQSEPNGDLTLVQAGAVMATIPAPRATDSSHDPTFGEGAEGQASYALTDLGADAYRAQVTVDSAFLATAVYPIVIDPSQMPHVDISGGRDGWTNSAPGYTNTSYESDPLLRVGSDGNSGRAAYLRFDSSSYEKPNRIIEGANIWMWATKAGADNTPVVMRQITGGWPAAPLTATNAPAVSSSVQDTKSGKQGSWYAFDGRSLYQKFADGTDVDRGVRFGASSGSTYYHEFESSNTSDPNGQPQLILAWDTLPSAPTLLSPPNSVSGAPSIVTVASPRLKVNAPIHDAEGDPVYVSYQISKTTDFSSPNAGLVWTSDWIPDQIPGIVPSGVLVDGQTYYWRARSWDVANADGPNGPEFWNLQGKDNPVSAAWSFTVSLDHFGANSRWSMWPDSLGNGVGLKVNEATGNLYLNYPLDSLATPAGPLDLGLSYNSQDNLDAGLGKGWVISAGPASDPGDLPVSLTEQGNGDGAWLGMADGNRVYFVQSSIDGHLYLGEGSQGGILKRNPVTNGDTADAWTFTTDSGSVYTFDSHGNPESASPASDSALGKGFTDTFSANRHLQVVADPLNRAITLDWGPNDDRLRTITTWDDRQWSFGYDPGGRLQSVTDPNNDPVSLGYDNTLTPPLISSITDGASRTTTVDYVVASGLKPQVHTVGDAGNSTATAFAYGQTGGTSVPPYNGQISARTLITDPRGTATAAPPDINKDDFQTAVDFDHAGLPVMISGPANRLGEWPVTTMAWDTNDNLSCSRSPAANAVRSGCAEGEANPTSDGLQTDYTYTAKAPYRLVQVVGPAPGPSYVYAPADPTKDRPVTSYKYDEGITGLLEENFEYGQLQGVPVSEQVAPSINFNWGNSSPSAPPRVDGKHDWSVRFTGQLLVDNGSDRARPYHFRLWSSDGATLQIGQQVLVSCFGQAEDYQAYNCGTRKDVGIQLWNRPYPITVEYYSRNATLNPTPHVNLQWDGGTGAAFAAMPTTAMTPNLGLVTSVTDPAGTTTNKYETPAGTVGSDFAARRLLSSTTRTDPNGWDPPRTTSYSYDDYGRVTTTATTTTDPNSPATTTNTDTDTSASTCLTKVVDPVQAGASIKGNLAETDYTCDGAGDVLTTDQQVGSVAVTGQAHQDRWVVNTYDGVGRAEKVITSDGDYSGSGTTFTGGTFVRTVTNDYDGAGRLKSVQDQVVQGGVTTARTTTYAYPTPQTMIETLPNPGYGETQPVLTHTYDAVGNEIQTKDAENHVWTKSYDASNRVVEATDPNTNSIETVYDDTGQGTHPLNAQVHAPVLGVPTVAVMDPSGVNTITATDLAGRKTSVDVGNATTDAYLAPTTYGYDAAGNVNLVTDPTGVRQANTYNGFGQVHTASVPIDATTDAVTSYAYDAAGHLQSTTDPDQHTTTYGYDLDGRVTSVTPPGLASGEVAWAVSYDTAGERVQVTDPNLRPRTWTYDRLGRLASSKITQGTMTAPKPQTTSYGYDGYSQPIRIVQPTGTPTLTFAFDALGRRVDRSAPGYEEQYRYDDAGRMTLAQVVSGSAGSPKTDIAYDPAGRPQSVTETVNATASTTTFHFGTDGKAPRLSSRQDPAGITQYAYDDYGRVKTLTLPFAGQVIYGYDDAGRVLTRKDPALLTTTKTFDHYSGRFTDETVAAGSSAPVAQFHATYYPGGSVRTMKQDISGNTDANNKTWTYSYDGQNRLTQATPSTGATIQYKYDGAGNRTHVITGSTDVTTTYDQADLPMTASDGTTTPTTYKFDAMGNLTKVSGGTDAAKRWTYAYDPWNRLVSATGSSSLSYTHDALDRTMTRSVGTATSTYTYVGQGEHPAAITASTGTTTLYAYSASLPIATCTAASPGPCAAGSARVFEPNMHGDLSLIADTGGVVKGSQTYGPFGDKRTAGGTDSSIFSFQSDPTDPATGLVDMGTRMYDPNQGRFTTQDVVFGNLNQPMSLNQYVYGLNNPMSMIDPTGMAGCHLIDGEYLVCPAPRLDQNIWQQSQTPLADFANTGPAYARVLDGVLTLLNGATTRAAGARAVEYFLSQVRRYSPDAGERSAAEALLSSLGELVKLGRALGSGYGAWVSGALASMAKSLAGDPKGTAVEIDVKIAGPPGSDPVGEALKGCAQSTGPPLSAWCKGGAVVWTIIEVGPKVFRAVFLTPSLPSPVPNWDPSIGFDPRGDDYPIYCSSNNFYNTGENDPPVCPAGQGSRP